MIVIACLASNTMSFLDTSSIEGDRDRFEPIEEDGTKVGERNMFGGGGETPKWIIGRLPLCPGGGEPPKSLMFKPELVDRLERFPENGTLGSEGPR